MKPATIEHSVQLLVEGNDPRNFFEAFIEHLGLAGIQVQNFGGVNELNRFLQGFVLEPGFGRVRSIGIVRDAERPVDGSSTVEESATQELRAFQSVRTSLRNANRSRQTPSGAELPVPDRPEERAGDRPSVSVLILPGDGGDGMLETLLCRTIAGTGVDRCIDRFFQCTEESGSPIHRPDKARARAYLATTPDPHLSVGVAAKRNRWNLDHEAFDGVRRFLRSLEDRPAT